MDASHQSQMHDQQLGETEKKLALTHIWMIKMAYRQRHGNCTSLKHVHLCTQKLTETNVRMY